MTLAMYLRGKGLKVETEERADIRVYNVFPKEVLMGTNYVDEVIERGRSDIQELIGTGVICWNSHSISNQAFDLESESESKLGGYRHIFHAYNKNQETNFEADFWHQDAGVAALMSLHHPQQRYRRASDTLVISLEFFERAFFDTIKALSEKDRRRIQVCLGQDVPRGYSDLLKRVDAYDRTIFFETRFNEVVLDELQRHYIFTNQLEAKLLPCVFRKRWNEMDTTITIHNRNTIHKRDYVEQEPHDKAGVLLRREY